MAIMEVKNSKACDIIKTLNNELEAMGKIIIPGRIKKSYDIVIAETTHRGKPLRTAL
jgi:hypothetical protein